MTNSLAKWNVNIIKVGVGVAIIILLTKLSSLLAEQWYFSFGAFLFQYPNPIAWQAVVFKFAIPIVAGLILGFLDEDNPSASGASAGFIGAFVQTWPAITAWELFAPFELYDRQGAYLVVYAIYFVAYAYLTMFGAGLTHQYLHLLKTKQNKTRQDLLLDLLDWKTTIRPIIFGVVTGAISLFLGQTFSN
jgi:hypothetical protein